MFRLSLLHRSGFHCRLHTDFIAAQIQISLLHRYRLHCCTGTDFIAGTDTNFIAGQIQISFLYLSNIASLIRRYLSSCFSRLESSDLATFHSSRFKYQVLIVTVQSIYIIKCLAHFQEYSMSSALTITN